MKAEKVVYILGAGFSKDAGGLLMTEFLRKKQLGSQRKNLNEIFAYLKQVMRQSIKDKLISSDRNIEEFLNLISEADLLQLYFKRESSKKTWGASKIYQDLIDCIVNELYLSMVKKLGKSNPKLPPHYITFARNYLESEPTVITFNWDHVIEWLLLTEFGRLNYSLDNPKKIDISTGDISTKKGGKLLKLHGSANWLWCMNPNHPIHVYNSWQAQKVRLGSCKRCHNPLEKLIVPPVWHKREYAERIGELWEIAADELCRANRIVIIGYSLPDLDLSAHYLFLLSAYLNRRLKTVDIVNGPNFDDKRYRQVFKSPVRIRNTRLSFRSFVANGRCLRDLYGTPRTHS